MYTSVHVFKTYIMIALILAVGRSFAGVARRLPFIEALGKEQNN